MKKFRMAFPVCALMALTLCAAPATALANDATNLAMSEEQATIDETSLAMDEEQTMLDANYFEAIAKQATLDANRIELEEERVEEAVTQDDQLIAEEEAEGENVMLGEDDPDSYIGKSVVSCELKGEPRIHYQGEDLDLSGMYWLFTYDDGSVRRVDVNPCAIDGYDKNRTGWQFVYIFQDIDWWSQHKIISVTVRPRDSFVNGVSVKLSVNARQALQQDEALRALGRGGELSIDKNLDGRYVAQSQAEAKMLSTQRLPVPINGVRTDLRIEAGDGVLGQRVGGDFAQYVAGDINKLYAYPLSVNSVSYDLLASSS